MIKLSDLILEQSDRQKAVSREIVPTKPVISRQPPAVQPRQVRGGSRAPVPQQTRSRIKPGS